MKGDQNFVVEIIVQWYKAKGRKLFGAVMNLNVYGTAEKGLWDALSIYAVG